MYYFLSKGVLLGVFGFFGYFFGVCFFLLIMNIWCFLVFFGNLKVCVFVILLFNILIVNFVFFNFFLFFEDFNVINCLFFLISGKYNLFNMDNLVIVFVVIIL